MLTADTYRPRGDTLFTHAMASSFPRSTSTKIVVANQDVQRTWVLFGDPTMRLP